MTNEEKIEEIISISNTNQVYDIVDFNALHESLYEDLMEMAEWKDKQYPHWNKQEENDIHFAINDWETHKFVCIMKDSQVCTWTGIKDESADGHIETHLIPDKEQYTIDDIVYWTEITI